MLHKSNIPAIISSQPRLTIATMMARNGNGWTGMDMGTMAMAVALVAGIGLGRACALLSRAPGRRHAGWMAREMAALERPRPLDI
ncbi:hypothetical protein [Novacetimonas pomaceti]|uniref:hypothetical protein n=2 Tax=Acetobacteraceae TaxID=433 RepID=UPI001C2D28F4|nr:hypothetical protein [Novacetimonas pomaceti]MBV1834798.1 hypothetical protein [Novacetimonas pomaceti]